jgi:hypothetical protein
MFVIIRKYTGCPDVREANRRIQTVAESITGLPGLQSYGVIDLGDGQLATVGLFETRAQAEQSAEVARSMRMQGFTDILPNPPEISMGEVLSLHRK